MSRNEENNRLGRGLSSLLGNKDLTIIKNGNNNELDLNLIVANVNQPRKIFYEESMVELVLSIQKYGVLQPIIVRKTGDDKYLIIAGERRYRAAKLAGLKTIPALIKNFDDKEAFSLSIIENIQRENLNSIDEANAYKELIEKYNYTQQDIADIVGKSRSYITNLLRLLTLPKVVQQSLLEGKIDMGHARALINCDFAADLIDYIVENELSVRDVEKIIKDGGNIPDTDPNKNTYVNRKKFLIGEEMERKIKYLKSQLGCNFSVNYNKKNKKYTLNVKFSSMDELDHFINNISSIC